VVQMPTDQEYVLIIVNVYWVYNFC
jgi:hypothetical protein